MKRTLKKLSKMLRTSGVVVALTQVGFLTLTLTSRRSNLRVARRRPSVIPASDINVRMQGLRISCGSSSDPAASKWYTRSHTNCA